MFKSVVLLAIFFMQSALACELFYRDARTVRGNFAHCLSAEEGSELEVLKAEAEKFIKDHQTDMNYQVAEARGLIQRLATFRDSTEVSNPERSRLWILCAHLHDRVIKKISKTEELGEGKLAFQAIKRGNALDVLNKEAAALYLEAATEMSKQNFFFRKIIESSYGIRISDEVAKAKKAVAVANGQA